MLFYYSIAMTPIYITLSELITILGTKNLIPVLYQELLKGVQKYYNATRIPIKTVINSKYSYPID